MELIKRFWTTVTYIVSIFTFSKNGDNPQVPLFGDSELSSHAGIAKGPIFESPGGPGFKCDYSSMVGWEPCSTSTNRGCWLRHSDGQEFNITTDYEAVAPIGTTRHYELDVAYGEHNGDGLPFTEAKLFNNGYPGPWLQACWGDTVVVKVTNSMKFNGTSIHWHGIRQNQTNPMDGTNGLTQCPIAYEDSMIYTWKALQYGSSWYHSHFSLQYADGTLGPMTLHGPSSANYDEPVEPILLTDWGHNSAFEQGRQGVLNPGILMNGRGNFTRFNSSVEGDTSLIPEPYQIVVEKVAHLASKKYLLRVINTGFLAAFIFSIDNHHLQIIGADFVPIHPYSNTSVLVGIGQRYHLIVEADPIANGTSQPLSDTGDYWIRTWIPAECAAGDPGEPGYERNGVLRYNASSKALPNTNAWGDISQVCSDDGFDNLVPIVPWYVGSPSNGKHGDEFEVIPGNDLPPNTTVPFPAAFFAFGNPVWNPLRIDYSDPMVLNFDNTSGFSKEWVVIPENYTSDDWVYLVLTADLGNIHETHPIHLHGHDFAILQQVANDTYDVSKINLKLNNPPRRDVVQLPTDGFAIIAFRADNPGSWLMHCHIARHASEGLAIQILERQSDADALFPADSPDIKESERVCKNWIKWQSDCRNWWHYPGKTSCGIGDLGFQDDSGI